MKKLAIITIAILSFACSREDNNIDNTVRQTASVKVNIGANDMQTKSTTKATTTAIPDAVSEVTITAKSNEYTDGDTKQIVVTKDKMDNILFEDVIVGDNNFKIISSAYAATSDINFTYTATELQSAGFADTYNPTTDELNNAAQYYADEAKKKTPVYAEYSDIIDSKIVKATSSDNEIQFEMETTHHRAMFTIENPKNSNNKLVISEVGGQLDIPVSGVVVAPGNALTIGGNKTDNKGTITYTLNIEVRTISTDLVVNSYSKTITVGPAEVASKYFVYTNQTLYTSNIAVSNISWTEMSETHTGEELK